MQGKFLAKRGLWVSEYRIESGLNCGGHAFATKGLLMGPILESSGGRTGELVEQLHAIYSKALAQARPDVGPDRRPSASRPRAASGRPPKTVLRDLYGADGTGWATPFLLVPEVTNVDDAHLRKLCGRQRRRRLSERQFPLRTAVLELAHLGERGGPPPPYRRGPARQPLLQGLC